MRNVLSYKTKQFLVVLLKLSIVALAFYVIFKKLFHNDNLNFDEFAHFLAENKVFSLKNICFLLVLTGFNWFFEILKWQTLASAVYPISFKKAAEQSFGALTASLLTPSRIGEYGVKAMYAPTTLRKRILFLNLLGNMMQMAVTSIFGIIGLLALTTTYPLNYNMFTSAFAVLLLIVIFIGILWILKKKSFKIKGLSIEKLVSFLIEIPKKTIYKTLGFSVLRYALFSFQLYILLKLFGITLNYVDSMVLISSMYILSSVIPTLLLFDVVIKSSVAIFVFSLAGIDELRVLCIMTLMWLLNFVLPSVIGSYYVLQFKLVKNDEE